MKPMTDRDHYLAREADFQRERLRAEQLETVLQKVWELVTADASKDAILDAFKDAQKFGR